MISIPSSWSERIPRNISPKRQVCSFEKCFSSFLTERGFVSAKNTSMTNELEALFSACKYYRIMNHELLQIVQCDLTQLQIALSNNWHLDRNSRTGGAIKIHVYSLSDPIEMESHFFQSGAFGIHQQRIVNFRFPGMPASFSTSFIDLFCDDFGYAMQLEKDLFETETIIWLDNMNTMKKYADWRMQLIDNWGNEWGLHHAAQLALWSQLKTGNIQRAKKCLEVYKKAVLELYNGINLKDINVERSTDLLRIEESILTNHQKD